MCVFEKDISYCALSTCTHKLKWLFFIKNQVSKNPNYQKNN